MKIPTEQELKEFCQRAGVKYHEALPCVSTTTPARCLCGYETFSNVELWKHIKALNYNFSDPREVLKVAMKKDNFDEFIVENGSLSKYGKHLDTILIDLITEPYALFWAYNEWLKNDKKI